MKKTMNSRDIARFHKYLEAEVSIKECSKSLGIEQKTLAKFTPEAIVAAKKKQAMASKPSATTK